MRYAQVMGLQGITEGIRSVYSRRGLLEDVIELNVEIAGCSRVHCNRLGPKRPLVPKVVKPRVPVHSGGEQLAGPTEIAKYDQALEVGERRY